MERGPSRGKGEEEEGEREREREGVGRERRERFSPPRLPSIGTQRVRRFGPFFWRLYMQVEEKVTCTDGESDGFHSGPARVEGVAHVKPEQRIQERKGRAEQKENQESIDASFVRSTRGWFGWRLSLEIRAVLRRGEYRSGF